ncbi:MAG: SDR family NAD(P)-dependent oxidoreductase [Candidatus Thermoplasmatota archaeon]|nr:SDR family NAD(P)-dependent oxidoreductase [Candidatus Thermoplasmatota archaeon]
MDVPLHAELSGQVALVTGANRGIGERIAAGLQAMGAVVYAGARAPDEVSAEEQRPVRLDVRSEGHVERALERIQEEEGRLDILVNNAGIIGPRGPLEGMGEGEVHDLFATNLEGPYRLVRHALPLLLAGEGGRVVNVSSGAGSFGEGLMTSHGPYASAKAGLNALTVVLHERYHAQGLIANSVCPGWVATDMGGEQAPRSPEKGAETPVWLCRFAPGAPSGRFWRDHETIPW